MPQCGAKAPDIGGRIKLLQVHSFVVTWVLESGHLQHKRRETANALSGAARLFSKHINYNVRVSVLTFICYLSNF